MEYKASLDTLYKIITAVAIIIMIAVIMNLLRLVSNANDSSKGFFVGIGGLLFIIAVLTVSYLFAPQKYMVTQGNLVIHRLAGDKVISIGDIKEIRVLEPSELKGTIRTFGSGGFFGSYGKFYNSTLGSMTWYVTQRRNRVLIITNEGRKIIISPDDISLVDTVRSELKNKA